MNKTLQTVIMKRICIVSPFFKCSYYSYIFIPEILSDVHMDVCDRQWLNSECNCMWWALYLILIYRLVEEYEDLRGRFEKAVAEIHAMKRELHESYALYDNLELAMITLRQDGKRREDASDAQTTLMAARVEDLTQKLSAAEKQVFSLL